MKDMIVFAFGRCNPPTSGHAKMVKAVMTVARQNGADHAVWLSRSQDKKKNPLSVADKVKYLKKMVKGANILPATADIRTFVEVAKHYSGKYKKLVMVAGSDRIDEYRALLQKYNGKEFNYEEIAVVSAGERDPDAEGTTGISGTKMRQFAADNNLSSFKAGLAGLLTDKDAEGLMKAVRNGMLIEGFKTFSSYLNEVMYADALDRTSTFGLPIDRTLSEYLSNLNSGFVAKNPVKFATGYDLVIIDQPGAAVANNDYMLVDQKTQVIHLVVSGYYNRATKTYKIDTLAASRKNRLKTPDFYAMLIKKYGLILTTTSQSEGGKRVWIELSKKPGIGVHGWDAMNEKPVNLGPNLKPEIEDEVWQDTARQKYKVADQDDFMYFKYLMLVAHKK